MALTKNTNTPSLSSPVTILEGLGSKRATGFAKLGVFTLEDMFFLMPRRYEDRRHPKPLDSLTPGMTECAVGTVSEISVERGRTEAVITDTLGNKTVTKNLNNIRQFCSIV